MKKYLVLSAAVMIAAVFFACTAGDAGPAGPDAGNTATAVFQNGVSPSSVYAGCEDVYLESSAPDTNGNGNTIILMGHEIGNVYRTVMRFDLSYIIPSNVSVVSAYLDLDYSNRSGTTTINAYALTKSFVEGEVTWNSYSAGNAWDAPGGDFMASAISSSVIVSSSFPIRITLSASAVQAWINNPAENHGFLLKAQNETTGTNWARYDSEEDNAPYGPKLTVNYILP